MKDKWSKSEGKGGERVEENVEEEVDLQVEVRVEEKYSKNGG